MAPFFTDAQIYELIGVSGFVLYVGNYFLLTAGKLAAEQPAYFVLNGLAATFVLVGLMNTFNLASALIQVFWIAISIWGIYLRFGRRNQVTTDQLVRNAKETTAAV